MRNARNEDNITLAGFIRRVKLEQAVSCSQLTDWRPSWDAICEDFWNFGFTPEQTLEAIEESEGLAP
jgi:hypothetical protein